MFIIIFFWHRIRDTHCVIFFLCCRRTLGFNSAPFYFFTLSLSLFFLTQKLCRLKASPTDAPHNKSKFSFFFLFSHYFHHILIVFLFFFLILKNPLEKKNEIPIDRTGQKLIAFQVRQRVVILSSHPLSSHLLCYLFFFSFPLLRNSRRMCIINDTGERIDEGKNSSRHETSPEVSQRATRTLCT